VNLGGVGGLARIAVASVLFGLASVFIKLAYDHGTNVATVLAVRAAAVLPWVAIFALSHHRTSARTAAPQLVPMGILAVANVVTFAIAVERMSPALVALMYYVYPILVIVGAHLLGWSRFNALTGLAAGATFLGVGLTIGLPQGEIDGVAVALSLVNGIGYAAYILLAERALRGADAVTSIALVAGVSSGLLLVGCLAVGVEIPSETAGRAILAALFASMFAPHVLVLSGIGRLGGPWGSIVSCLEVVTTVVATALVLSLPLGPGVIAGGTLVILGGVAGPILAQRRGRLRQPAGG
jgi:drug/metabolite transporter (DMT)-like permease